MTTSSNTKEQTATAYIPFKYSLDEFTSNTVDGDVIRTLQVAGLPFETISNGDLNALYRTWLSSVNSIGSKNTKVALWTHVIRRKIKYDLTGIEYDNWFSTQLNNEYAKRIGSKDFFTNELFVSPVFRQAPSEAERIAQKMSKDVDQKKLMRDASISEIEEITNQLQISLRRFKPKLLGTRITDDGVILSESAEFFSKLLNGGKSGPVRLNNYSIRYAIQRNDISFSGDVVMIDYPDSTKYAGILSIKAPYSIEKIRTDILDGLISLPFEFILSQSLTFMSASKAEKFLSEQRGQIATTSNNRIQLNELDEAIAMVQNGKFAMGEHEFILTIFGNSISELNTNIAQAKAELEDNKSLDVFRESRGTLISQYFGMLPGNFKMGRPRAMPLSTNNFASFFPMHNFMTGNASGSQWGMPIALLQTTSRSPYFLNYHVKRGSSIELGAALEYEDANKDLDADQDTEMENYDSIDEAAAEAQKENRKESGNYISIGVNGVGKTLTNCALHAFTRKKNLKGSRPYKTYSFDKDYGRELFIRAIGGQYFKFKTGEYTGLAPFDLPDTPENRAFILKLAKWCASKDLNYKDTVKDEELLRAAIADVYRLNKGRRWARIRDLLPKEGDGCLYNVLGRWVDDGAYAWVLDSEKDMLSLDGVNDFAFDMTSFLDDDFSRTPILATIKHKIDISAPGSPHCIDIDEASHALKDPFLREQFIEKPARTIRKNLGIVGLHVQNAEDITEGLLSSTLKNQFPTMFIFPNPKAERHPFVNGLGLSEKEYDIVRNGMNDEPGKFLLKKGVDSVVLKLDLTGMNDMIAVLSGSADNVPLVNALIAQLGDDPSKWLPEFFKRRN